MQVAKSVLAFLDREGQFKADFGEITGDPGWPTEWMSIEAINEELLSRNFWSEARSQLPEQAQQALVAAYLEEQTDGCKRIIGPGWVYDSGRFRFEAPTQSDKELNARAMDRPDQRRRHGRCRTELISCQLGPVVDLSLSGMMVQAKPGLSKRVGKVFKLTLRCLEQKMRVRAEVIWVRQEGKRCKIGLQFVDVDEFTEDKLRQVFNVAAMVCRSTI